MAYNNAHIYFLGLVCIQEDHEKAVTTLHLVKHDIGMLLYLVHLCCNLNCKLKQCFVDVMGQWPILLSTLHETKVIKCDIHKKKTE